jgi:hypothetical protein
MEGSIFAQVNSGITLGCISPEARDLLDTIMEQWEQHIEEVKKHSPDYEPTPYGMAYWLVRWSGLVQPAKASEADRCEKCGGELVPHRWCDECGWLED